MVCIPMTSHADNALKQDVRSAICLPPRLPRNCVHEVHIGALDSLANLSIFAPRRIRMNLIGTFNAVVAGSSLRPAHHYFRGQPT